MFGNLKVLLSDEKDEISLKLSAVLRSNRMDVITITYTVFTPNAFPRLIKPSTRRMMLRVGYVHPIGMFNPYCRILQRPVNPPLDKPFGRRNDVHARQKIIEPTVIRKYSLINVPIDGL